MEETRAATVGFIGLGNMGSALASNLVRAGHPVVAYDVAGPARVPEGARYAPATAEVAGGARRRFHPDLPVPARSAAENLVSYVRI